MAEGQSAYRADSATPAIGLDYVTLAAGGSFVICSPDGEIEPGGAQGYFAADTRVLSLLRLRVDGAPLRVLRTETVGRMLRVIGVVGDPVTPTLLVERDLVLSDRLLVTLYVTNLAPAPVEVLVDLTVSADFADVFEVKRGTVARGGFVGSGPTDDSLRFVYESNDFHRELRISVDRDAEILRDGLHIPLALDPGQESAIAVELDPVGEGTPSEFSVAPLASGDRMREHAPDLESEPSHLNTVWSRSCYDLASLFLRDPMDPERTIVAAGSPWFMALFGRDSLIASWQALPLGHELALGTLAALAARQGEREVPSSAEQPGRIPHEVRSGEEVRAPGGWGQVYYGSVDATPLFVMALAEAWRWGADPEAIASLIPAAEQAVDWIVGRGDADGDGFVEYPGRVGHAAGLVNEGWKDSDDAIRLPDGSLAEAPIALVEVQGYCHAALLALAALREGFDRGDPLPLRERAADLRQAIDERFWLEGEDCYALALDGAKRPVPTVTSNAGHLLWTGTALEERAGRLARRLMADDMFTGFGLRTLSAANGGYNPLSYHCGSVWPHDTAIVAAGMLRYGLAEQGCQLSRALADAAATEDGRLPELFGGFPRSRFDQPVPYPTSCSPQAWSAGAPLLLVRAMFGLEPDVPAGVVRLRPCIPDGLELALRHIPVGDSTLSVRARGSEWELLAAPEGLRVEAGS